MIDFLIQEMHKRTRMPLDWNLPYPVWLLILEIGGKEIMKCPFFIIFCQMEKLYVYVILDEK